MTIFASPMWGRSGRRNGWPNCWSLSCQANVDSPGSEYPVEHIINAWFVNDAIIQYPVVSRFRQLFSRFARNKFPVPESREFAHNGLILLPFLRPFCRGTEKFPVEPGNRRYRSGQ